VAREPGFGFLAAAGETLAEGASVTVCIPGLPPAFLPVLRWGERTGRLEEAMEHLARWWIFPVDLRLPLYYLASALGSAELPHVIEEGREVFDVDRDWKQFAAELAGGASFATASAGKARILPRPYDRVLAGAETAGNLQELLLALWEGSQHGMIPYEAARDRATALRQACHAWSLLLSAGFPLKDSLGVLTEAFTQPELRKDLAALRVDDFVPSLEGTFTPSICALLRKAYECGNMSRTLLRIAQDLERSWLPA
jgi:type II secretory pathway component PulF